jgi:hypothetical protein
MIAHEVETLHLAPDSEISESLRNLGMFRCAGHADARVRAATPLAYHQFAYARAVSSALARFLRTCCS